MAYNETPMKENVMREKIRTIVNHPAAGLVTVLVINTGIVVASVIVAKKLAKEEAALEA
jgi:hypothetical protein